MRSALSAIAVIGAFVVGYAVAAWLDDRYHQAHPDKRYGEFR